MRRALELDRTPAPALPLRFLLAAPWFGVAAGLLLAWHGGGALVSRWSGATLALVHLLTLGFLTMTMAGSLLQMLPVVAGLPLRAERLGRASCPALAGGTILLALGFVTGNAAAFAAAAGTLAVAFALLLGCMLPSLWQRARAPMAAVAHIVRGMRSAAGMLVATVCAGLALAAWLAGGPAVPAPALTDVHAALGLGGWVALLVAAVSFQVVPMFQGTSPYPPLVVRWLVPMLVLALAAWCGARWFEAGWRSAAALAGALGAAAWIGAGWRLLARRRRTPDPTTAYWRFALASLAACLLAWSAPADDARTLFTGVAFLGGFAMTVVDGMLYKIVPFLLWYHMQERSAPGTRTPKVAELVPAERIGMQFGCHAAAVGLAGLACWMPALARSAGLMLAADCLLLALTLAAPLLRHRRLLQPGAQPS